MPRVVMPLSVLVTMQADAAFLHSGCCAGTTSRPAYEKKFDGNGHGSTSAQCQSDCWNQGGNVVTWDNGWCTCWLPQYMTPASCGFATDAGNCGSDMTNAETYYSFSLALSTKQQLGLELGGTKMSGNGCCQGTTSHPASDKAFDGAGFATTEADCNWKCWNAPYNGNVVTWDPAGNWCTCWTQSGMNPSSCILETDTGDCGSPMPSAVTSYKYWALSTEQQTGLELGGTKMSGNGCCQGTTSHPASDKLFDGSGYATTEADCNWKCWNAPYNGNVVTWDPAGNWCTCWTQSGMHPSSCILETDTGDCGSPMPSAVTSYKYWALSTEQQTGLELGGTKMSGNGCCQGTTSHAASDKAFDGAGFATTEADCNWKCWNAPYNGNVVTWDPAGNWCTCWTQSGMHPSSCILETDTGDCGSPMPSAVTSYKYWALSTEHGNSTSGVEVMV